MLYIDVMKELINRYTLINERTNELLYTDVMKELMNSYALR